MPSKRRVDSGRLPKAIGLVGLFNAATIVLMYTVAGFFGPLNDLGVGTAGVLIAALAWQLASISRSRAPYLTRVGVVSAAVAAAVVVLGSALVLSGRTGWFLAGHVTMLGYAGLGPWVIGINVLGRRSTFWPRGVTTLGLAAGLIMLCGFFAVPAIVQRLDDPAQLPWFVMVAYAGGGGWFLLLPVWALRLAHFQGGRQRMELDAAQ